MAIKTAAELKAYFETGDTPTQSQFEDLIDSTIRPYKVYTALLNQESISAPVATILENTLGEITYTYNSIGSYNINLPENYAVDKVYIVLGNSIYRTVQISSDTSVPGVISITTSFIDFFGGGLNSQDACLINTSIEIRVYN